MDRITKALRNRKLLLLLIVLRAIVLWAAPTMSRRVRCYPPCTDRELPGWGTMDQKAAAGLQSVLDADVNRLACLTWRFKSAVLLYGNYHRVKTDGIFVAP